ncbi:hypothetical protein Dxin01_01366 [Deinococcus xinjiangensis]|uniref:Uncharacterized protein n=1 Tax=Deinococcus xinjiangensis TaxID=457454 RepID=A0ABP9V8L6_9DEIO
MRYVLLVLLAAVAALYFTIGIRIGILDISDVYLFNANGTSTFNYRTFDTDQHIRLLGVCDVKSGEVTLRFLDPNNQQVAGQTCATRGKYSLDLTGGGATGIYTLEVQYKKFTGHLNLDENRFGAH